MAEIKTSQAFQYYDATVQELENYRKDKPLRDRIFQLKHDRSILTKQKYNLWDEFYNERVQNVAFKNRWSLSEDEFDKTNKQLKNENSSPISSDGLINLANEFYRQPSRYVNIIKTIRHRMESGRA